MTLPRREAPPSRITGLYAILDRSVIATRASDPEGALDRALAMVLAGGCRVVQYRDKTSSPAAMGPRARRFVRACREAGALLIVNDHLDAALASGADGCHLGQDDTPFPVARVNAPPGFLLGRSTHSVPEAVRAQGEGADYIGVGAVFRTMSKRDALEPRGPRLIAEVASAVSVPIVAIGGITRQNVREIIRAGASAFAVISDLFGAPDVRERTREFLRIWEEEKGLRQSLRPAGSTRAGSIPGDGPSAGNADPTRSRGPGPRSGCAGR
jgi:thiamine-phosphate pyrophosphorylase